MDEEMTFDTTSCVEGWIAKRKIPPSIISISGNV